MSSQGSVSEWIASLKGGDQDALEKVIRRYQMDLLSEATRRLRGSRGDATYDHSDVSQEVWICVWKAAEAGRIGFVTDREKLWALLVAITNHKVIDRIRSESATKRGGTKQVITESSIAKSSDCGEAFSLDTLMGTHATPEFLATVSEEFTRLMNSLRDDSLRLVAKSRMQGMKDSEIAELLSTTPRTVQRKLTLIRDCWKQTVDDAINA